MDIQVRVTLGDRIQVKAGGIDARLTGNLDLKILGLKPEDIERPGGDPSRRGLLQRLRAGFKNRKGTVHLRRGSGGQSEIWISWPCAGRMIWKNCTTSKWEWPFSGASKTRR